MAEVRRRKKASREAPPEPVPMSHRHGLVTVAIFAILGPAIGAVSFAVVAALVVLLFGETRTAPATFLYVAFLALPMAYAMGGVQAAVTGVTTAAWGLHSAKPPAWQIPFYASGLSGIVYFLAFGTFATPLLFFTVVAAHILAGLACWMICAYLLGWRRSG